MCKAGDRTSYVFPPFNLNDAIVVWREATRANLNTSSPSEMIAHNNATLKLRRAELTDSPS